MSLFSSKVVVVCFQVVLVSARYTSSCTNFIIRDGPVSEFRDVGFYCGLVLSF